MKVLQIAVGEGIKGGGVGRIASRIAEELSNRGYESVLITCKKDGKKRNYKSIDVKCIRFPFFSSVVIPKGLEEIIKKESPDIIISHGYASSLPLFSYRIAKKLGIKHIFAVHSYPKESGFRKIAMSVYDVLAREAINNSKIIYFSSSSKKEIGKKGKVVMFKPEKMFFIEKQKEEYLLFVGRLDENKRADMFVEICKELGEKGFIAGIEEGEGKKIRKIIEKEGLDIKIKEVPLNEMPRVYSRAKALVICSKYEGLPLVWLEAIASETPVFTTRVGDYKEILSKFYGDVERFSFSDKIEGAEKIRKFLSKPDMEILKIAKEKLEKVEFIDSIIEVIEGD